MGQEVKKEQKGRQKSKKNYKIIVLHYFFHGVTNFFFFLYEYLRFYHEKFVDNYNILLGFLTQDY